MAKASDLVRLRRVGRAPWPAAFEVDVGFWVRDWCSWKFERTLYHFKKQVKRGGQLALSEVEGSVRPTQSSYFLCFDDFLS